MQLTRVKQVMTSEEWLRSVKKCIEAKNRNEKFTKYSFLLSIPSLFQPKCQLLYLYMHTQIYIYIQTNRICCTIHTYTYMNVSRMDEGKEASF